MNVRDVPEPEGLDIIDSALWFQAPSTLAGVLDPTWQPAARDVLYSFLHECSRASIPELCSSLKVPLWGTKLIMEHRVYKVLCMRLPPSLIASEVNIAGLPPETVSTKSSASITELIALQRQRGHPKMVPWRRAPDGDTDVPSQLGDERRITVTLHSQTVKMLMKSGQPQHEQFLISNDCSEYCLKMQRYEPHLLILHFRDQEHNLTPEFER
jgi:hypothetical protein